MKRLNGRNMKPIASLSVHIRLVPELRKGSNACTLVARDLLRRNCGIRTPPARDLSSIILAWLYALPTSHDAPAPMPSLSLLQPLAALPPYDHQS